MSRPSAVERLARLLSIVPWVVARDGPLVSEVCQRFQISERDLMADLNLLFMCGVYPYTPDALIEVDFDGGRVWVRFADWFRRPLRLTPEEGLRLVAAARAALALPGTRREALARAVSKLETVLGAGEGDAMEVELDGGSQELLPVLQNAVEKRQKVRLAYYSFGRDEIGERTVQPWRLFSAEGHWYLLAWCELAVGRRLFRLDRVRRAEVTHDFFDAPAATGPVSTYESRPNDPVVVLELGPSARWVAGQYPNEGTTDLGEGRVEVRLRVSSRPWLERLLLQAGTEARVVSGLEGARQDAARRLLSLYRRPAAENGEGEPEEGGGPGGRGSGGPDC